jgi:hypothetical protein
MKTLVLAALVLAAGCSKGPSEEQCKSLLDHLVDLEFKKAGAAASTDAMKAELAKQKQAVSEAKAAEFVETCTKKTSKDRVECALNASDLDTGVAKCDDTK